MVILDHGFADVKLRASYEYHKQFTLAQVIKATSNFKDLIGRGGYGRVYYGILPNGQEVAVKVSNVISHHQIEEYAYKWHESYMLQATNEVHNNIMWHYEQL